MFWIIYTVCGIISYFILLNLFSRMFDEYNDWVDDVGGITLFFSFALSIIWPFSVPFFLFVFLVTRLLILAEDISKMEKPNFAKRIYNFLNEVSQFRFRKWLKERKENAREEF